MAYIINNFIQDNIKSKTWEINPNATKKVKALQSRYEDTLLALKNRLNDPKDVIPHTYNKANHRLVIEGKDQNTGAKLYETQIKAQSNQYYKESSNIAFYDGIRDSGSGKCFKEGTKILMYDGTLKEVQQVAVGDLVMGDDSTPRRVLNCVSGTDTMYEVKNIDDTIGVSDSYTVNSEHILCFKQKTSQNKAILRTLEPRQNASGEPMSAKNFVQARWYDQNSDSYKFKLIEAGRTDDEKTNAMNEAKQLTGNIPNYSTVSVKKYLTIDQSIKDMLRGYKAKVKFTKKDVPTDPYLLGKWLGDSQLMTEEYNVPYIKTLGIKIIPQIFKCNSKKTRLNVLAGIIDKNGMMTPSGCEINTGTQQLNEDIQYLSRSLGFKCSSSIGLSKVILNGELERIPTKIKKLQSTAGDLTFRVSVESKDIGRYYGFELDGNHKFFLGNFTITHNSYRSNRSN